MTTSKQQKGQLENPVSKKAKIDSKQNEREQFLAVFKTIQRDLINVLDLYKLPQEGKDWFSKMLQENVPNGKLNRGLTVPSALQSIMKRELSEKELFDAQVLGWCIELLQADFLIQDDIMDSSITRRGKPCWYRNDHVGMIAINDSMLIEMCIYKLLKLHFKDHESYIEFIELFHETTFQTELGQLMDLITAPEDIVDLSKFSIDKHAYIVEYKTAYYSFYLPIALAMHYAKIKDESAFKQAKNVLIPLGEYFQVQDDYLDCYGKPEVIGKIGTDIEDNKCSWLIVQALSLANDEQRKILDENYGKRETLNVQKVKEVFAQLEIEKLYEKYEEDSYIRICALIEKVDENLIPQKMFVDFMNRIYKRTA